MANHRPSPLGIPPGEHGVDFHLAKAATSTKLLLTFFIFFLLLSFLFAGLYARKRTGPKADDVRLHYRGAAEEEVTEELYLPIPYEELLRMTHVHTFGMAILFYLLGHTYLLTAARPKTKVVMLTTLFLMVVLFLAAPWLVTYGPRGSAHVFIGSHVALCILVPILCALPLYEMWIAKVPQEPEGRPRTSPE